MPDLDKSRSRLILSLIALLALLSGSGNSATISVTHGESIQAAVDMANPGDIIEVMNGTYKGSISVNKQLVLSGIGMPVVDANRNKSAIILNGDRCTIHGFKVINSSNCGISLLSDFNTIANNTLEDIGIGIHLEKSHNNTIAYNDVRAGGWWNCGLLLESSKYNIIKSNDVSYHGIWGSGITLADSDYNNLTGNNAGADGWFECKGILLKYSNANSISGNTVWGDGWEGCGIYLDSASNNYLKSNNAHRGKWGMYLAHSHENTIERNIAKGIKYCVFLVFSRDNIIENNTGNIQLIDSGRNTVAGNTGWVYYGYSGP
jgi:nitrous oxidase accessory protein